MITPSSLVRFLNVPFSPSQNNVLKFPNVASQLSYMESKIVYTMGNCSYIREGDGEYLKVNKVVDSLYNCNYVMFQNPQFGERWFYAFIEKLKYVNGQVSHVVLKMDVFQTFQFDFELLKSFVERQTFNTDYYNTLADTPNTGDLEVVWEYEKMLSSSYFILFNADPTVEDTNTSLALFPVIGNYTMPCYMCVCTTMAELSEIVQAVSNKGRGDRIQACYIAPCSIGSSYDIMQLSKGDLNITNSWLNLVQSMPTYLLNEVLTLNIGYTPTFKKEFSYPYAKMEIVDRITGKYIELDLSKFDNPQQPKFKLIFNITDNVEYKVVPINYNGVTYGIENSLVIHPSVDLPVFSNSYSKYLKDNGTANMISSVMAGAGAVGSILTGNIAGAVGSFGSIAQTLNADSVARKQPNQVSNIKGDAFEYLNYSPSIFFRVKIMDDDHLKMARNFWNAYGYPVRRIANYNYSSNKYNFIKTVGANILAPNIPSEYQKELENILNNGVTIWNNNYLEYDIL